MKITILVSFSLEKSKAIQVSHYNAIGFYINRIAAVNASIMINFVHLEPDCRSFRLME